MTPAEWRALQPWLATLPTPDTGEDALLRARRQWAASIQALFEKSRTLVPEPYVRRRLHRYVTLFGCRDRPPLGRTLVVCFTGQAQRMMAPLPVFLQHFEAETADVALIVFPRPTGFRKGIEGISDSFETTLVRLARLLRFDEYERVVSIGASGGGLPAVIAAWRYGFGAALSFGGEHPDDPRWTDALGHPFADLLAKVIDREPVPTWLAFGGDAESDRAAAIALSKLMPARRIAITGNGQPVGHNALFPLLVAGQLHRFLHDVLFSSIPAEGPDWEREA